MSIQTVTSTFVGSEDKFNNVIPVQVQLTSGTLTQNIIAPCEGRLVAAFVQSQTTTTTSNTITLTLTNESNSAVAMIPAGTFNQTTVITSNTVKALTLGTSGTLNVDLNDNLELLYTEAGTIAGGAVILYFQAATTA